MMGFRYVSLIPSPAAPIVSILDYVFDDDKLVRAVAIIYFIFGILAARILYLSFFGLWFIFGGYILVILAFVLKKPALVQIPALATAAAFINITITSIPDDPMPEFAVFFFGVILYIMYFVHELVVNRNLKPLVIIPGVFIPPLIGAYIIWQYRAPFEWKKFIAGVILFIVVAGIHSETTVKVLSDYTPTIGVGYDYMNSTYRGTFQPDAWYSPTLVWGNRMTTYNIPTTCTPAWGWSCPLGGTFKQGSSVVVFPREFYGEDITLMFSARTGHHYYLSVPWMKWLWW